MSLWMRVENQKGQTAFHFPYRRKSCGFHWTYGQKSLEFLPSLGSDISAIVDFAPDQNHGEGDEA
jgi:hypothetical protein